MVDAHVHHVKFRGPMSHQILCMCIFKAVQMH